MSGGSKSHFNPQTFVTSGNHDASSTQHIIGVITNKYVGWVDAWQERKQDRKKEQKNERMKKRKNRWTERKKNRSKRILPTNQQHSDHDLYSAVVPEGGTITALSPLNPQFHYQGS